MIERILKSRVFSFLGGVALIYTGLGWLGITGGWENTGSTISIVGGSLFLINGIILVIAGLKG